MEPTRSALSDRVIEVLNRHDPMGLSPGDDEEFSPPWDEYAPEARELAQLLHANGTVSSTEVDEVWRRWFDQPAGSPAITEAIAAELRALLL
jgi:hypothetical protein